MKNEVKVNNKVFLMGTVDSEIKYSHSLLKEEFYEFMLRVPRLSEQCDFIPITISQKHLNETDLELGKKIALTGQFRSFNKMEENRSRLMLTVFLRELHEIIDEQSNPNKVDLIGYICKPPVYRTTPFNREICDILLAVNRAYSKSDYIPCIAWGKNARFIREAEVGQKVEISGRIQSRQYIKRISEEVSESRTAYELSICSIDLASKEDEVASASDEY